MLLPNGFVFSLLQYYFDVTKTKRIIKKIRKDSTVRLSKKQTKIFYIKTTT